MVDEPQGSHYGGVVAAPAFTRVMEEALTVRDVLPIAPEDRFKLPHETVHQKRARLKLAKGEKEVVDVAPEVPESPRFVGKSLRAALQEAERDGITVTYAGWGVVVAQIPEKVTDGKVELLLQPPSAPTAVQ